MMKSLANPAWLLLLSLLLGRPVLAAEEIQAGVVGVGTAGEVKIALPDGAVVAVGDRVRIEGEVPGIGWVAIRTLWKIVEVRSNEARAAPEGAMSGIPQVGYRVVVFTDADQTAPSEPLVEPGARYLAGVHDCDRLAAQPFDRQAVAPGVEYDALDAQAVIASCKAAIAQWPDTPRFYAQLTRGYYKAGAFAEAYEAAKAGADRGSAQSMAFLGVIYKAGSHVQRDLVRSLYWFERSAENGNIAGMVYAAAMYLEGQGTAPDASMAARWFQEAANLGNGQAMANLGKLYDAGRGVPRDPGRAARLLLKAQALRDEFARSILVDDSGSLSIETRRKVQEQLKADGYYGGAVDGKFGPATKQALAAYSRN